MSSLTERPVAISSIAVVQELQRYWGWLLTWGIALIVVGMLAVSFSFSATLGTVMAFGMLAIVGGCAEIVGGFVARKSGGFVLKLLAGVMYIILGILMVTHPIGAAAGLTLMIAVALLAAGVMRIILSIMHRFEGWPWVLLNGVISLVMGVMIWRQWPASALWVIGLFLGIDLIFSGWSSVMWALKLRSIPKTA
jgi:uncharacterized membrane protein HdeD (DUF308 family)